MSTELTLAALPRIEQFLDLSLLPDEAVSTRLSCPVLVLEVAPDALQARMGGFQTTKLDTASIKALWQHVVTLRKNAKRVRSDVVRFVCEVKKRDGALFSNRITVGRIQFGPFITRFFTVIDLKAYILGMLETTPAEGKPQ